MDYFITIVFVFQAWVIISIVLLVLELFDGSAIFFLPLSVSGFLVGGYLFALDNNFFGPALALDKWYELVMLWAFLGLLISLLLAKVWKNSSDTDRDINKY